MPKISIIVPVYNVEKYIDKCLNSLENQTLKDIEIIVVNDGSTDKSKEIIQKHIKKASKKIKYLEKTNGGLSSARNYGMKYAKGEYIGFLDSDDYVEKNMYEEMYDLAQKENSDIVECDFIWEYPLENKKNRKDKKGKKNRVMVWNKIIKRKIIEKENIKFPEGLIYEDIEFYYKLMPYVKKISYINKYFVHYIQRKDSISNNQNIKVQDIFKILDNIIEYYKKMGIYKKYKIKLNYIRTRILLGSSMKRILKIKDKKIKWKLIKLSIKSCFFKNHQIAKKRICFGITKLSVGGAERVLVDIANKICDKYEITIFTIYSGGELEKELDSKIKIVNLCNKYNKLIPIYLFIFKNKIYNKYLKNKYDIKIAFLEGPITRIFSNRRDKNIAWIHNDISKVFGKGIKAKIKKYIDKNIYKKYDKLIFVSEDNKKSFNKIYGGISEQKVIYNYIDKDRVLINSTQKIKNDDIKNIKFLKDVKNKNITVILTVARLVKQKGIERLARIHKRLLNDGKFHKIYVIGDGPEKNTIQNLIIDLNIQDSFILLGERKNPYPYMKLADYFVLFSYFEGYGMVLEEAKIFNKKIIITDTAGKEALRNYDKSIIVKNTEEAIYLKLKEVLQ